MMRALFRLPAGGDRLDDDYEIGQCLNAYAVEARTQDFIQKISAYAPCFRKGHIRHGIGLDAIHTVCDNSPDMAHRSANLH